MSASACWADRGGRRRDQTRNGVGVASGGGVDAHEKMGGGDGGCKKRRGVEGGVWSVRGREEVGQCHAKRREGLGCIARGRGREWSCCARQKRGRRRYVGSIGVEEDTAPLGLSEEEEEKETCG
ncbi:hypothetical protein V6Z11_A02G107300 [Gossypium hirsutum]